MPLCVQFSSPTNSPDSFGLAGLQGIDSGGTEIDHLDDSFLGLEELKVLKTRALSNDYSQEKNMTTDLE